MKNSYKFVEQLKNLTINHDECMVSFEVISLFTKIPVDVAKTVVLERLKKDDILDNRSDLTLTDIMTALNLCLDNTYLYFRGKLYRQMFGVAMGSPVSVIIANLVMENVEEGAMSTFLNPPKFWRRYVDDTFVIIKKTEVDEFHNHVNNIEASTKFTIEHETNNFIPFLHVCVTREASGGLMTKIYKKPTHTNRYLIFNSAHSMSQKQELVECLLQRAQSQLNSKRANKTLETLKIMEALKKNDCAKWFLKRTVKSLKTKANLSFANNKEIKTRVVLPYVLRYFEALSKILRNVGILVCSKPHLTSKDMLPKAKDSVERSSRPGVVY